MAATAAAATAATPATRPAEWRRRRFGRHCKQWQCDERQCRSAGFAKNGSAIAGDGGKGGSNDKAIGASGGDAKAYGGDTKSIGGDASAKNYQDSGKASSDANTASGKTTTTSAKTWGGIGAAGTLSDGGSSLSGQKSTTDADASGKGYGDSAKAASLDARRQQGRRR